MKVSFAEWLGSWPPPWIQPWHVALLLSLLFLGGFLIARVRLRQAREDWANAFFYSPSQKARQRRRRQAWQDRVWALLILTLVFAVVTGVLYLQRLAA